MLLDTPICNFGWRAPDFALKDAHGATHRMTDCLLDCGLLLVFICNHCPYVKAIAGWLAQDARTLKSNHIGVLAVMSNDYVAFPADAPERMIEFVAKHDFDFPYLVDEDQSVAKAYGAVCTPDFFGLNSKGELQYRGRLDDVRMDDATNRVPEMINAMLEIAETGQGPRQQTPSMGCSIKWR